MTAAQSAEFASKAFDEFSAHSAAVANIDPGNSPIEDRGGRPMKAWISVIAAALVISALPAHEATADGRRHVSTRINIGIGIGQPYGSYYRPYRRYPRSYVGVSLWPQPLVRRTRTRERTRDVESLELFVYPAGGQSERQLANDRYDCHVWSSDQTRYDPTRGAGSQRQASEYARAMTACLEARNYVVR